MSKKIVLGFSGGLDTSFCVKYLTDELGYEVHSSHRKTR
jgi:argininosuccinate synthase